MVEGGIFSHEDVGAGGAGGFSHRITYTHSYPWLGSHPHQPGDDSAYSLMSSWEPATLSRKVLVPPPSPVWSAVGHPR